MGEQVRVQAPGRSNLLYFRIRQYQTASSSVPLTVMTYNVGNGLADPARLATFLRENAVDIVGLQELAASQGRVLSSDLMDIYPHQVLIATGFSGKGLLSRYPIFDEQRPISTKSEQGKPACDHSSLGAHGVTAGTGKVVGVVYFGLGQEACSCASAYALDQDDWFAPMIRNQGALLVRGFAARDTMMQYMAKADSPTKGRDGTSHFGDIEKRNMVSPISM